ncbi:MAG TPA: chemotaxis protein CheD [Rhodocyclaceae bacterium]
MSTRDQSAGIIDISLQPGEFHFAGDEARIRTVLGSCVSMVCWHPALRVGGMCHYMLPYRAERRMGDLDGRYADEAMAMMFREMRQIGTRPEEYEVKVFGGANMFPDHHRSDDNVGTRNVEAAWGIVEGHGLRCVAQHTAGIGHRSVIFDVGSGNVWVKHRPLLAIDGERRRHSAASGQALARAA